jgi:hypothetical protein
MSPAECKERAAECRRMAESEPNLRQTWDRLAIEAEISQGSGPPLRAMSQLPSEPEAFQP